MLGCSHFRGSWAVIRDAWPSAMGLAWGDPSSFPVNTRRRIHCWKADAPLPEALSL
jgi:hypothetical protein